MPNQKDLHASIETMHKKEKIGGEGAYITRKRGGGRRGEGKEKGRGGRLHEGWMEAWKEGQLLPEVEKGGDGGGG